MFLMIIIAGVLMMCAGLILYFIFGKNDSKEKVDN